MSRSSVAKWPDIGATISTRGPGSGMSLRKRSSVPNGVWCATSSCTATVRSPIVTESSPNDGRTCVSWASANTSQAALILRIASFSPVPSLASRRDGIDARAQARKGCMRSECAW